MSVYGYDSRRRRWARARRRLYDAVVVPAVNFCIRWLARVCFLGGMFMLLAIAAGWTSP